MDFYVELRSSGFLFECRQNKTKKKTICSDLVAIGTSASPLSRTAGARRTNATTGLFRKSSSPTNTLHASAPGGIFFMK